MAEKKKSTKRTKGPIDRKWLDGVLAQKLPQVLKTVGQNPNQLVAEFVKLIQLERKLNPRKKSAREVIWMDWVDADGNPILQNNN